MAEKPAQTSQAGREMSDALKGWVMVALTSVFVVLYAAALAGWLKPLTDERMVTRLEPVIFVIIGYYFGRLPAQQNEKTLKDEIGRQAQKADAAQHAKEQVQQAREALEEKVKNARAALTSGAMARSLVEGAGAADGTEPSRATVAAALNVLNS